MTSQNPTTDDTVTSQNGHCEHCDRDSCYDDGEEHEDGLSWHLTMPEDALGSTSWQEGFCPACAERERIVAWMRRMREDHSIPYDVRITAVLFAQLIEQGKHLDPRCESSLVYERPHPPHAWVTGVADMWCPGFPEQTQLEET